MCSPRLREETRFATNRHIRWRRGPDVVSRSQTLVSPTCRHSWPGLTIANGKMHDCVLDPEAQSDRRTALSLATTGLLRRAPAVPEFEGGTNATGSAWGAGSPPRDRSFVPVNTPLPRRHRGDFHSPAPFAAGCGMSTTPQPPSHRPSVGDDDERRVRRCRPGVQRCTPKAFERERAAVSAATERAISRDSASAPHSLRPPMSMTHRRRRCGRHAAVDSANCGGGSTPRWPSAWPREAAARSAFERFECQRLNSRRSGGARVVVVFPRRGYEGGCESVLICHHPARTEPGCEVARWAGVAMGCSPEQTSIAWRVRRPPPSACGRVGTTLEFGDGRSAPNKSPVVAKGQGRSPTRFSLRVSTTIVHFALPIATPAAIVARGRAQASGSGIRPPGPPSQRMCRSCESRFSRERGSTMHPWRPRRNIAAEHLRRVAHEARRYESRWN